MLFTRVTTLILLLPAVFAAPSPLREVRKANGRKRPNGYIVTLKDGAARDQLLAELGPAVTATWKPSFINGFAGTFNASALEIVRAHPDVVSVTEDGTATSAGYLSENVAEPVVRRSTITQTDAPWGLERISRSTPLSNTDPWSMTHTYRYESTAQGEGVDVYVMDSGINLAHTEFEGRATWGATFGGYADADGLGHGTHCAGTVGGKTVGVAKKSHLIAVKVLSDQDFVYWSDLASGLDWVAAQAAATGRPSVVSISLQGSGSDFIDDAVARAVDTGLHVVVCAGNFNIDVADVSPARANGVVTVAAMDINNAKASFSDFGASVEIWAPGVSVYSTYIGSTSAYAWYDGTSMATPHVAGVIAGLLSDHGNMSPAAMTTLLQQMALQGVLSGVPSGTPNLLLNNGFTV